MLSRTLVLWLAACSAAPVDPGEDSDTDGPAHTVEPADTEVPDDTEPPVDDTDPVDTEPPPDTDAPVDTDLPDSPDLRLPGPFAVDATSGRTRATSGCDLAWERFSAQAGPAVPLVVLTHGLERSKAQMTTWARHLATWGLDVVAPSSCQASVLDLDQAQNGRDLIELVTELGAVEVIYAGHSAGGLASWVAASEDVRTVGLFGLDPTEWLGIGAAASPSVSARAFGLVGDAGTCNAFGSGVGLLADVDATALRVVDADHCDFETPTSAVCTLPCGRSPNGRFSDAELRSTIRGLLTAALRDLAGVADDGAIWWTTGGAWHDRLDAEGRIALP